MGRAQASVERAEKDNLPADAALTALDKTMRSQEHVGRFAVLYRRRLAPITDDFAIGRYSAFNHMLKAQSAGNVFTTSVHTAQETFHAKKSDAYAKVAYAS